ncbi:unnamed protein product [Brassica rapa subsp. narinosa]
MEVIDFSETEMEAAEQLVQLSEEDTLSCSSGTGLSVSGCEGGGGNTKRHNDVISDEVQNDGVSQQLNKDIIETIYYHALNSEIPTEECTYDYKGSHGIPQLKLTDMWYVIPLDVGIRLAALRDMISKKETIKSPRLVASMEAA